LASAAGVTVSTDAWIASATLVGPRLSASFPLMIRETSRTSSMSLACARALRSTMASGRSNSASGLRLRSVTVQPRIALSGVRSS
jgi:hypothetical protein